MKRLSRAIMPRMLSIVAAWALLASEGRAQRSLIEEASALKTNLEEKGVHTALMYDAEGFADAAGGATYLGNLNLQLTLDLHRLFGWPGATIFIDGLNIHGQQPSNFAGDAQGVSSIAGPNKRTLEEAWIQQSLFGNRLSILVGRYDLNSEFDRLHAADLFLNFSFGANAALAQTGKGGPSIFPNTSTGTRLEVKPIENLLFRVAILDGVPVERPSGWDVYGDGLLIVSEAAFLYRPSKGGQPPPQSRRFLIGRNSGLPPYDAKLAAGIWHQHRDLPRFK